MYPSTLILGTLVACSTAFFVQVPPAAFQQSTAPKCDEARSLKCINEFGKNIGIPSSVSGADQFIAYVKKYFEKNGKNGLVGICSAAHMLYVCEGDQFAACTSFPGIKGLGVNDTDAYTFASFTGNINYECGAGYDVFYNNFECYGMVAVSPEYKNITAECTKNFEENAKKDPANVCEYFQEFTACLSDPYVRPCGKRMAHAFCMASNGGFNNIDPQCKNLNCDYLM